MDRVLEAFRNCISEPKCRDCPWTECEDLDNKKVKIPADLALAVNRLLTSLLKDQKPETDREKAVKGLKCCTSYDACNECPYEIYKDKFAAVCQFKMIESALALLKEQEPAKPIARNDSYFCEKCRGFLCNTGKASDVKFCSYCGNPIDWT